MVNPATDHARRSPRCSFSSLARPRPTLPLAQPSLPVYRLLAIELGLIVLLVAALRFGYNGQDIDLIAGLLLLTIGAALVVRWRGHARTASAIEASALILGSGMTVACLSVLFTTIGAPFRDDMLAAADRWLFPALPWPAMVAAIVPHPRLIAAMCWVYTSLYWQPFIAILLLAIRDQEARIWRFVHAWLLALALSLVIFAFAPAITALPHYHIAQASIPALTVNAGWHPAWLLGQIRSGQLHELGVASMTGLIDFPSFHAAAATLLAWAFRSAGRIGTVMIALDVAVLLTTPLIGSHYFIDVLAGIAVALVAILATRPAAARGRS